MTGKLTKPGDTVVLADPGGRGIILAAVFGDFRGLRVRFEVANGDGWVPQTMLDLAAGRWASGADVAVPEGACGPWAVPWGAGRTRVRCLALASGTVDVGLSGCQNLTVPVPAPDWGQP